MLDGLVSHSQEQSFFVCVPAFAQSLPVGNKQAGHGSIEHISELPD
jgi:hypothetical protein